MKKTVYIFIYAVGTFIFGSTNIRCKKQDDFLNTKPIASLSTINNLSDAQNLLNNEGLFNTYDTPGLGETSCDDYYLTTAIWLSKLVSSDQNTYIWAKQVYPAGTGVTDWSLPYQEIYYANVVLDALPKLNTPGVNQDLYNKIKGTALFYRSIATFNLLQTFALPYDSANATSQLGVPLRLSSDLNIQPTRASQRQCYDQILSDLANADILLPVSVQYNTQPSRIAAKALLARIYLTMGSYAKALQYADQSLQLNSALFDYNNIIPNTTFYFIATASQYPLSEDIYHCTLNSTPAAGVTIPVVDSTLFLLYDSNDLRKKIFFTPYQSYNRFRGSYEFKKYPLLFSGLANDEVYLMRAECYARLGNTTSALADLNTLLTNRYKKGKFTPIATGSSDSALAMILQERRKELCFRGLRWIDLRRLNKDSRYAVTLTRSINGANYSLPANDPRYALPIPDDEIALSGLLQNAR